MTLTIPKQPRTSIYNLGLHTLSVGYSGDANFVESGIVVYVNRSPGPRKLPRP